LLDALRIKIPESTDDPAKLLAFHGKRKNLTLDGRFQIRRSRLQLIAELLNEINETPDSPKVAIMNNHKDIKFKVEAGLLCALISL